MKLHDPRQKHPAPPFSKQPSVDIPGHENEMVPHADHGEQSYTGHGRLEGLVALITGADSGIGRAVALAFAREGADVAFTYLSEDDDAQATMREVEAAGQRVRAFRVDQTDRATCDRVVQETIETLGGLNILVNNAAFQQTYESLQEIPDEELDRTFDTNILSAFYLCRAALPHLQPGSSIINTVSIQSFDPSFKLAPYAATKAALASFTLSLAQHAAEKGIRVNGVAPGPVWTPLIPSTMPDGKVENFGKNTLLERPAQPAELAPVYVLLASEEASYITGEIYGVTGGRKQL